MPYSLLQYPGTTPVEGSDMWRYTGIRSWAAQVTAELESGIHSALTSVFIRYGMLPLHLPIFALLGADTYSMHTTMMEDRRPNGEPVRDE